jgi:hypothetical protein
MMGVLSNEYCENSPFQPGENDESYMKIHEKNPEKKSKLQLHHHQYPNNIIHHVIDLQ